MLEAKYILSSEHVCDGYDRELTQSLMKYDDGKIGTVFHHNFSTIYMDEEDLILAYKNLMGFKESIKDD